MAAYLNDHLAGSMVARELAEHRRGAPGDKGVEAFLDSFIPEIEQDRAALTRAMEAAGIEVQFWKQLAGVGASWIGRLRPRTDASSPQLVRDIEMLIMGVRGKLLLWSALSRSSPHLLPEAELRSLISRARRQLDQLEALHERAVDLELVGAPIAERR